MTPAAGHDVRRVIRRRLRHPARGACAAALALAAVLLWKAAAEDFAPDEGFTVRRIEAAWAQVYFPFAVRVWGTADPFDTRHVYDMNPPLYFALVRVLAGAHPGRVVLRLFSIAPMVAGLLLLAAAARHEGAVGRDAVNCGGEPAPAAPSLSCPDRRSVLTPSVRAGEMAVIAAWALSPAVWFYGHEARPYALALCVVCAMVFALRRWGASPVRLAAVMCLAGIAGLLLHFQFVWVLAALWIVSAVLLRPGVWWAKPEAVRAASAWLFVGVIVCGLVLAPQSPMWGILRRSPSLQMDWNVLQRSLVYPLIGPLQPLGARHVTAALVFQAVLLMGALTLLPGARGRRAWGGLALALWLVPTLGPILVHVVGGAAFFERYTLLGLPGWALVLGWVVREAVERRGWLHDVGALLVFALGFNAFSLGIARLPEPLRQRWTPAVKALLEQSRAGDYYIIEPEWQGIAFAANAGRKPAAAFLAPDAPVPADARTIWFVCDDWLPQWIHERFLNRGWRIEPVVPYQGKYLWKLTRSADGSPSSG
ncbi:MAG: hypothetical protein Kow0059_11280 [Candidatus Sumerlaeia bacterium]